MKNTLHNLAVLEVHKDGQTIEQPCTGATMYDSPIKIYEGGTVTLCFGSVEVELRGPLATAMRAGFKTASIDVEELC